MTQVGSILVVEDDHEIQQAIRDVLSLTGYPVVTAEHGGAALDVVEHQPVGLIVLDMKMPVMDGWAFARAYRARVASPAPIVVLTAARDAAKWAAEVDAIAYLAKPFDLDDLLDLVERYAQPA